MIDPQLVGKTAIITGANNRFGIGAAIARGLAAQGVAVFLTYFASNDTIWEAPITTLDEGGEALYRALNVQTPEAVVRSIQESGGRAAFIAHDLSDADALPSLFDQAEAIFGSVDILVNNAAHSTADTFVPSASHLVNRGSVEWLSATVPTLTAASHDAHFAVNTRAVALMMVEFARRHVSAGKTWGRVINLTTDGSPCFPSEIAYGASKHALESYSRSAAVELGQFGITVNAISPGPTQTGWMTLNMMEDTIRSTPLRRVGYADEIADAAVFLASHQARWITGQVIHVNGGHRV